MSAFQEVFKRVEKKYLLSAEQYKKLRKCLDEYTVPDSYGESKICNIYFDTPDNRLVRTSMQKPVYKEKLRMRSYGTPKENSTVFVELKKKYKGVVYKRRVDMPLAQAESFVSGGEGTGKNQQIEAELKWVLSYYKGLAPAMYLSYDRIALYAKNDPNLRITFDTNITYRQEKLSLSEGSWGKKLLGEGERIMEIKIPGVMPLWLCDILDRLEIYPTSFSKYGSAYCQKLSGNENNIVKEKVNNCA